MSRSENAALSGIQVIELGTMITAPLASMMLADLGADVIKVEHPKGGDPFRRTAGGDYGPNFVAYNHSKRSLKLDLTQTEGGDVFRALLAKADVLVENFRPGVLRKFGFGQDALSVINPRLIHCSITGFGEDGPYSARPSYDTVGIALSGISSLTLDPEHPELVGPTIADNVTGMYACSGILAALHARERSGKGQRVEVNMLESAISMIPDPIAYFTQSAITYGPSSRVASSHCYAFRCSDERLITVHLSVPEKFWQNYLDALEAGASLGGDERFKTRRGRIDNYRPLYQEMATIVAQKPRAYWEQRFTHFDVPFAPVHTIPEVLQDPQVQHLGTFQTVPHPTQGDVVAIQPPIQINGQRAAMTAPPVAGEHSDRILTELGYLERDIQSLRDRSII